MREGGRERGRGGGEGGGEEGVRVCVRRDGEGVECWKIGKGRGYSFPIFYYIPLELK